MVKHLVVIIIDHLTPRPDFFSRVCVDFDTIFCKLLGQTAMIHSIRCGKIAHIDS